MVRKNQKTLLLVLAFLCIIGIIVTFVLLKGGNHQNEFPIWEKATDEETVEGVQINFLGMNVLTFSDDTEKDALVITLENTTTKQISYGEYYWVDYLSDGQWYTIYRPESAKAIGVILAPGEKRECVYDIPHGGLKKSGQYRMYLENLGYCQIDIIMQVNSGIQLS